MIQRKYNLNLCLAITVAALLLVLLLGALQKQFGVFDGADAAAIKITKSLRSQTSFNLPLAFGMTGITSLGDETGLMIVICIVFWLGHTAEAIAFLLALLFGNILIGRMKEFFELARPARHRINWLVGADGYGYPSGHSMVGMLYSWLIYSFANKYWYLCLIAGLLMATSRIYLGVHFFSDTVGGLLCGFGVVVAATGIYAHVRDLGSLRESIQRSNALKVILSFALSAIYLILAWGMHSSFKYAGLLAGFFIIYSMLGFQWRSRNVFFAIIMVVIGLILLLAVRIGLSMVFPKNNIADYLRYFILGFFLAISPLFFMKLRLLKKVEAETRDDQQWPAEP